MNAARLALIVVAFATGSCITGIQVSLENFAQSNIQKEKWSRAKSQLTRADSKDTVNVLAKYLFASYYFAPANPEYNIDSAYWFVAQALTHYPFITLKERDRLLRNQVDSMALLALRDRIDSAAFARAKQENTVDGYTNFIERFSHAIQVPLSIELRNEVAYLDAMKENTYQAYRRYLDAYPDAKRAPEAREKYERLLYEARTGDGKLQSYQLFLAEHPESFHRVEAERHIYEILTASGRPEDFIRYINAYPTSYFQSRARNLLFHLYDDKSEFPAGLLTDSLKEVVSRQREFLIPVFRDRFGFMRITGEEVAGLTANQLPAGILCDGLEDDIVQLEDRLFSKSGKVIAEGIEEFKDLGSGFVAITMGGCIRILHKSGDQVERECVQDARLAGNYLAVKRSNKWSVRTLTGRELLQGNWRDVHSHGNLLILENENSTYLLNGSGLSAVANKEPLPELLTFDSVQAWSDTHLLVSKGGRHGILDQNLHYWIELGDYELLRTPYGAIVRYPGGVDLVNLWGTRLIADSVASVGPWTLVRREQSWYTLGADLNPSVPFDSAYLIGPLLAGTKSDSLHLFISPDHFLSFHQQVPLGFLPGRDSLFYIMTSERDRKTILSVTGDTLFSVRCDELAHAGEGFFRITRNGRKGLLNQEGKIVLPLDYEAIGNVIDGNVQLLKNSAFGLWDARTGKLIEAAYDRNIVSYGSRYLIAGKNGLVGLIDRDNKQLLPFEFEEIRYWNDTAAFVRKNFQWIMYNINNGQILFSRIRNIVRVSLDPREEIVAVRMENDWGVLSNTRGVIVPISFSEVVPIGPADHTVYFTDRFVEEADIHVVIYYDENGKQIRRQVLETESFNRIYCDGS